MLRLCQVCVDEIGYYYNATNSFMAVFTWQRSPKCSAAAAVIARSLTSQCLFVSLQL